MVNYSQEPYMDSEEEYKRYLRDLLASSGGNLTGSQTLPDGTIVGFSANDLAAKQRIAQQPPQMLPEQQQPQVQPLSAIMNMQQPQQSSEAFRKQQIGNGLRNETTGAQYALQSAPTMVAPSGGSAAGNLLNFGKRNNIPQNDLMAMIQYQSSAGAGSPSAEDLFMESFRFGTPVKELISAYSTMGAGARNAEKENLGLMKTRAEIDNLRAKPTSSNDAAMAKVLVDIRGDQLKAKIPGTPEYERVQKRDAGEKKEQSAWSGSVKQADQMTDYIDRVLGEGQYKNKGSKLGFFATGLPGQVMQNVGGTDARDLRGDLNRIKAIIGFEELNKMRRESPTGGALGNVTERELEFLQSVEGSLDQAQSPEQLDKMLWDIKSSAARLKNDLIKNPPKGVSSGGQAPQKSGAEQQAMLMQEAQRAIAAGAPRDAVMQRLQERIGSR